MFRLISLCILSILCCFSNFLEAAKIKKKPFVTCTLHGQLGNQLHEIATTLAYAWDNDSDPIFPELNKKELNIPINKDRIFFRLKNSRLPRKIRSTFKSYSNFEKEFIPKLMDVRLFGYFQTWEYYHHHRDQLIETFAPSENEENQIRLTHEVLLSHPNTVAIHVRTFNKEWASGIPFVGLDYYERAMDLFPEDCLFVVFSDRINWCKHHFKKIDRPMVFIEGQDHIQDFFLMSMLKHNIIGNSSYSWWAAYLNKNQEKIVVGPSHFIQISENTSKYNALLPEWIELQINCSNPYPEDLKSYDEFSQSIDTQ